MQLPAAAGLPYEEGFQGFVQLSKEMMRGRNSLQQQQTVAGASPQPSHRDSNRHA